MHLTSRVTSADRLTPGERDEMFALMQDYYENVRRREFDRDLAEKQWVIQLVDPAARAIRGFSTQTLLTVDLSGEASATEVSRRSPPKGWSEVSGTRSSCHRRPVRALFSGDTIVHRDYWGQNPLAQTWGRFATSLIDRFPEEELYWFLISQGYRTYRFLPVFFREFYPRRKRATPRWARERIDALGRFQFRDKYDAAAGIVRAGPDDYRLRSGVADVDPARIRNPDIRFFVERNPNHAGGDELCCLAPLSWENFTTAARRVIGRSPVRAGLTELRSGLTGLRSGLTESGSNSPAGVP